MWMPVAPFAADGVVEVEDANAVCCFIRPGRGAVGDGFGKKEQGAGRAFVGVPYRGVGIVNGFWRGISCFVAAADHQCSAFAFLYGGEFPDHAGQSAIRFAGDALIVV